MSSKGIVKELLDACGLSSVNAVLEALEKQEEHVYGKVHEFFASQGMPIRALPNSWSKEIPLVRPLIPVWREEVFAYCNEHGLKPVFDKSNMDTTIYRNRLRHELIPYLESMWIMN